MIFKDNLSKNIGVYNLCQRRNTEENNVFIEMDITHDPRVHTREKNEHGTNQEFLGLKR